MKKNSFSIVLSLNLGQSIFSHTIWEQFHRIHRIWSFIISSIYEWALIMKEMILRKKIIIRHCLIKTRMFIHFFTIIQSTIDNIIIFYYPSSNPLIDAGYSLGNVSTIASSQRNWLWNITFAHIENGCVLDLLNICVILAWHSGK